MMRNFVKALLIFVLAILTVAILPQSYANRGDDEERRSLRSDATNNGGGGLFKGLFGGSRRRGSGADLDFPIAGGCQGIAGGKSGSFGIRRKHSTHRGADWYAEIGTPIKSPMAGLVKVVKYSRRTTASKKAGRQVHVLLRNGCETRYFHLNAFAKGLRGGISIPKGTLLGTTGVSGRDANSRNPHLHFEYFCPKLVKKRNGKLKRVMKRVDPTAQEAFGCSNIRVRA